MIVTKENLTATNDFLRFQIGITEELEIPPFERTTGGRTITIKPQPFFRLIAWGKTLQEAHDMASRKGF